MQWLYYPWSNEPDQTSMVWVKLLLQSKLRYGTLSDYYIIEWYTQYLYWFREVKITLKYYPSNPHISNKFKITHFTP